MEHPHHSIFLISCVNFICLCKLLLIIHEGMQNGFTISSLYLSHFLLEFSFIIVINGSQGDQMNFLQICHFIFFIFCSILFMWIRNCNNGFVVPRMIILFKNLVEILVSKLLLLKDLFSQDSHKLMKLQIIEYGWNEHGWWKIPYGWKLIPTNNDILMTFEIW